MLEAYLWRHCANHYLFPKQVCGNHSKGPPHGNMECRNLSFAATGNISRKETRHELNSLRSLLLYSWTRCELFEVTGTWIDISTISCYMLIDGEWDLISKIVGRHVFLMNRLDQMGETPSGSFVMAWKVFFLWATICMSTRRGRGILDALILESGQYG